ncbi:RNA-splicing ligase RtcB [Actinocatenispora thailandica]|uniref:3'-phosphate/5'-hydroxy nucleic acid ligase n=1 Tax=Actinocatenispora thailandica TaxID=227318 RepID=A0A7R7DRF2_9ACTN|nr:RtcB family protein [Actinocatenispora thailandica]BCJ36504.1 RNA-splicing ligase RtcB [Actinocatenispora thailandica]
MSYSLLPGTAAPVRMWTDPSTVDGDALRQLRNIGSLPWVHGIAVMPDVHLGKGATVGSVIAMRQAVAPAAVGVDIGCGMSAVRTSLTAAQLPDDLGSLRSAIEAVVPVGFAAHDDPVDPRRLWGVKTAGWAEFWHRFGGLHQGVRHRQVRAMKQLGTLGGGNHFCEVCVDTSDSVWVLLHSGSRNIGKELAERHMAVARKLPHNADLPDRDLAVFVAGTPEMAAYRRDLYWAQEYARRNRELMLALVSGVLRAELPGIRFDEPISCHHNYVAEETYDGVELLVTRKGAIRAGRGELGIIPGSMGTGSYLVRGLGNTDAFVSASHGAGRRMSRTKAKQIYREADLAAQTAGIECRKDAGVVDEIPAAYKDLDQVMAQQSDLVEVVQQLRQVICIKG